MEMDNKNEVGQGSGKENKMKKYLIRLAMVLLVVLVNIGCDQKTKDIATNKLPHGVESSYLGDTFRLIYVENTGAFLSLGANQSERIRFWLLKFLPVLLLIVLSLYTLFSQQLDTLQIIALSFILGGGISNIFDRLLYGKVVDFMNMGIGDLRTGIFNFADVSIMVGMGLFLFINFRKK